MRKRRPSNCRRSWLFLGGADVDALIAAADSGADVLIHELEDFTAPDQRPAARAIAPTVLAAWKERGIIAGVRVNPLADCGGEDLTAVMTGTPDVIMLPKVGEPAHVAELDHAILSAERAAGIDSGSTELVPNIELAGGLIRTHDICKASPRVSAALVASEDMATDLGAERGRDGEELKYVRARFHVECVAAGVVSIDAPYTWTDNAGVEQEARHARRLGYKAKSAVDPRHAAVINCVFTPSEDEVEEARRIIEYFETAQAQGYGRAELDGSLIETPIYRNAQQLLDRFEALTAY